MTPEKPESLRNYEDWRQFAISGATLEWGTRVGQCDPKQLSGTGKLTQPACKLDGQAERVATN